MSSIVINVDNIDNIDNVENIENVENVENVYYIDYVDNVDNIDNFDNVDIIDNIYHIYKIYNIYNIDNIYTVDFRLWFCMDGRTKLVVKSLSRLKMYAHSFGNCCNCYVSIKMHQQSTAVVSYWCIF